MFLSEAVIRGLLTTQLATIASDVTMVRPGEVQPDHGPWCKLSRLRVVRRARNINSAANQVADIEAHIAVVVPSDQQDRNYLVLSTALTLVAAVMGDRRMVNAPKTTEVVTTVTETDEDGDDEQRAYLSGVVVVRGYAQGGET